MLRQLHLCVEHRGADLTPEMTGPVPHELDPVLALLVAHEANKVELAPMTLNVSVEVTFLCKSLVANIARKRFVNYC